LRHVATERNARDQAGFEMRILRRLQARTWGRAKGARISHGR